MKYAMLLACAFVLGTVAGCGRQSADEPPSVRIGDTLCDQCNMIISDERWATATIVNGPRGPEPRLFDDFNCQVNYEVEHEDEAIVTRWSRSHSSGEWLKTKDAVFLMAPLIRSPMGSHAAAFATAADAEAASIQTPGDILSFADAWKRLGSTDACCQTGEDAGAASVGHEHDESP